VADAARVAIPASSRSGSVNRRRGGLQGALGEAPRCLGGGKIRPARAQRHPAMAATGSFTPTSLWVRLGNKLLGRLRWEVTEAIVCSHGRLGLG
jgi:hypothetical protein